MSGSAVIRLIIVVVLIVAAIAIACLYWYITAVRRRRRQQGTVIAPQAHNATVSGLTRAFARGNIARFNGCVSFAEFGKALPA